MGALFALFALVVVPFVILGVALKVLCALILLPFKIVGGLLKGLFGLVAGGVGLVFGLFALLFVFVLLPLAPLLLLGAVVWLALKAFSPAARTA